MTHPNRRTYLAVDAGGTKAEFLLADDVSELARVRVGSIKVLTTPAAEAEKNFAAALHELERSSGVSAGELTRTCIGASGYSVPSVQEWLRMQHRRWAGGELLLCGDEEIALDAAFEGGRGVLALAGTGSNVVGRTADGKRVRAGGWGPVLGDEGSGHWIGLEAVRGLFHAIDERKVTRLEEAVLEAWRLSSREALVERGNLAELKEFAALTPVVVRCAAEGDRVAAEVLRSAGRELARLVTLVIREMEELEPGSALPKVALAGGILGSVDAVRTAMAAELRAAWPEVVVAREAVDPVLGALWRARKAR